MRSCSMQAEVASELGRLRASVGGLEDTRADLTKQIADELHRLYSQCRGGNHVVGTSGVAGGGKGEYEREAFAALLRESSALHEVESELRFQGDVIRLKDDLTRSLAEVQGLPAEEFGQKLEGLRSSVEVMQVICTSFGENRAAKTKGANSGLKPLPFSAATRAFLLSMCQQLRRELEKFVTDLLAGKCQAWPPRISLSSETPAGANTGGVLHGFRSVDPAAFDLLLTASRLLCSLQNSNADLRRDEGGLGEGLPVKQGLWLAGPLLDEFKRRICFHFGQQGGSTFRLDRPEWLLKYGLSAAQVFKEEGRVLTGAIKGTGLEDEYCIPQELVVGVIGVLEQILPQYLQTGAAFSDGGEDAFQSLLLHLASKIREYDLKFAELLNPSLRDSFYSQSPFSPLSSWGFGLLIRVLLREEYFEDWVEAESKFLEGKVEGIFGSPGAWDIATPSGNATPDGDFELSSSDATDHTVPDCVEQLCGVLLEYVNFSRSFPGMAEEGGGGDGRLVEFLDRLGGSVLEALFNKLSWRVDSYDPYGDTSRHLAIGATTSCLASAAHVEGILLEPSIYDPHTSRVPAFQDSAKGFVSHIKKWSQKLVSLVTKEFEGCGVVNLAKALRSLSTGDRRAGEVETIRADFLAIFDDLVVQLREVRPRVSPDVFRVVWTSVAACVNNNLLNNVALGVDHSNGTAAEFVVLVSLIVSAFEEFTRRPKTYFKLILEASDIFSMDGGECGALLREVESLSDSESVGVLRARNIHSLSLFQATQLLSARGGD